MRLATLAGLLLVLTAFAWVLAESHKAHVLDAQCRALATNARSTRDVRDFVARLVEKAPCCTRRDAEQLRAIRIVVPAC
jgi:hypothetical protein